MWQIDGLNNESDVEQKFLYRFLTEAQPLGLGLPDSVIQTKANLRRFSVGKGAEQKLYYPDYVVVMLGLPLAVIEAKAPNESVDEGYRQAPRWPLQNPPPVATQTPPSRTAKLSGFWGVQVRAFVSTRDLPEYSHVYPQSEEVMGPVRSASSAAGRVRLGINLQGLPPGRRSSWPRAESDEEEFVYVIEGEVDAWIDGELHRMFAGDFAALPAGTAICHCVINNSAREAALLVVGEAAKPSNRVVCPLNPSRRVSI